MTLTLALTPRPPGRAASGGLHGTADRGRAAAPGVGQWTRARRGDGRWSPEVPASDSSADVQPLDPTRWIPISFVCSSSRSWCASTRRPPHRPLSRGGTVHRGKPAALSPAGRPRRPAGRPLGGAARRCQLTAVVVWCRGGRLDVAAVDVPGGDVRGGGIGGGGEGADFGAGEQWGWGFVYLVFECAIHQAKDSVTTS